MMLSLDGLVARPGRHGAGGWGLPPADPALKEKLAWFRDIGLHLMGARYLPRDGRILARVKRRLRRTDEQHPQGRLLPDTRAGRLAPVEDRARRSGRRDHRPEARLELVDTTTYSTGATLNIYRPAS